jgi:DNA polymerase-3 subunit alpha
VLRRQAEATIGELRERGDGEVRWVAGVVTGLSRKYTKRGELMATFVLEDLASAIEVMVFPRTMLEYGPTLADDAVVCVKGRVDAREEPVKLICLEVKPVQLDTEGTRELELGLPLHLTQSVIDALKRTLREHPGDTPVVLRVGTKRIRLPAEFHVDAANGLHAELRTLPGPIAILS